MRLSPSVKPRLYELSLNLDIKSSTYSGDVVISIDVDENVKKVTLNSFGLNIIKIQADGNLIEDYYSNLEEQTLTLVSDMSVGAHKLRFKFNSKLGENMMGLYKASYHLDDSSDRYMIVSQFEPIYCRRCFPCFDEPSMRASFDISLTVEKNLTALSNMPVKEIISVDEVLNKVSFERSPSMPTYTLAFVVGELNSHQRCRTKSNTSVKAWFTQSEKYKTEYVLELADEAIRFFEEMFDIPFPLPELKLVAVPEFEKGAMENFGLITFKESLMLIDIQSASSFKKQDVFDLVFHEVSHQWFGNLVTIQFWDDLWLKEGFATWMAWSAAHKFHPEWKIWDQFSVETLGDVLFSDSKVSTHPVASKIGNLADIIQSYDTISYQKGCVVVTMLVNWLGEELFLEGLIKYMKKYKWGAPSTKDLWQVMSQVSKRDISTCIEPWCYQKGYPILTVEESEGKAIVSQSPFTVTSGSETGIVYPCFLSVKNNDCIDTESTMLGSVYQSGIQLDKFIKLNANRMNLFRTAYSRERWKILSHQGKIGVLSVSDRVELVDDLGVLCHIGRLPIIDFMEFINEWKGEKSKPVWTAIVIWFYDLLDAFIFDDSTLFNGLKLFLSSLLEENIPECFYVNDDDTYDVASFKDYIFGIAGYSGSHKAAVYSANIFDKYVQGDTDCLDTEQAATIFKSVAKHGDKAIFESLWKIYHESSGEVKESALIGLGRFEDPEFTKIMLNYILEKRSKILKQDVLFVLMGMSNYPQGIELKWNWLRENWAFIGSYFEFGSSTHLGIVQDCIKSLVTEEHAREIKDFFEDKAFIFEKTTASALESIQCRVQLVKREKNNIICWLVQKGLLK